MHNIAILPLARSVCDGQSPFSEQKVHANGVLFQGRDAQDRNYRRVLDVSAAAAAFGRPNRAWCVRLLEEDSANPKKSIRTPSSSSVARVRAPATHCKSM